MPDFPPVATPTDPGSIGVRGARLHNLRDVDVDIPRGQLVAFTGVSGSGKSSLAFGTIHGEAQRRYLETVAPFARRLIQSSVDPRVGDITGLPPAVALGQRGGATSRRSSVGTVTTTSNTLRMLFSRCGDYPAGLGRLDSDHFSANTTAGACPQCSGIGVIHEPTEASMVPDPSLSIADKAIASWPGAWQGKNYRDIVATLGYDIDKPWRDLPRSERDFLLFSDEEPVVTVHSVREAHRIQRPYQGTFASARRHLLRTLASASPKQRQRALRFVETRPCPMCGGRRLHPDALRVTWGGMAIDEASRLPVDELLPMLRERLEALGAEAGRPVDASRGADTHRPGEADPGDETHRSVGLEPDTESDRSTHLAQRNDANQTNDAGQSAEVALLTNLVSRLDVLVDLGLGHLDLGRPAPAVSAGELQRLRLASLLRSGLFGVVYVLDEPSAGLHPRDVEPLLRLLRALVETGNSVLVVEHDMAIVAACSEVVDVGPGAGGEGGHVLFVGEPAALPAVPESVTGRYLVERVHRDEIRSEEPRTARGELVVEDISFHNLDRVEAKIGLGLLTAVTGVSGSGKSSLLAAVEAAVAEQLGSRDETDAAEDADELPGEELPDAESAPTWGEVRVTGDGAPRRLVRISQKPIGRTVRSTLATYTGLYDHVRKRFAAEPDAKSRGFGPGRFSFNVAEGRCPTCQGEGVVSVELLFLPGAASPCPDCHGARYSPETLTVRHRGLTIAEVLDLTVAEALAVFTDDPPIARALTALDALGLGYLGLGRPATDLSGGEAQRIKLATELQKERRADTLYLFDEPSTGLHPADVHRLLARLHALVDAGHTVVLVDHHPAALATADAIVEVGPGAGARGGRILTTDATSRPS